jgi:glucose-6-phosphate isomerase
MLTIDYTNMLGRGGVSADSWDRAAGRFARAVEKLEQRRKAGELGFLDLPADTALHSQSTDFVAKAQGRFDDVVLLGIGGSALGPIALRTALRPYGWNSLDGRRREGHPRMHVLDNVDPRTVSSVLDGISSSRTLLVVTSKSGGTAETMSQFLVARAHLEKELGSDWAREHIVFVTDPKSGALRALADRDGIATLDVPPNVGGRFSVLSPVGVLPAALMGIDTAALLAGAKAMADRCSTSELARNPAGVFAMLQYLADAEGGKHMHVLMPYSDPLRDFADWFVQLWAESLGKIGADGHSRGPTPIAALGATDQHSQVQLFMEGPADKTVTFLAVEEPERDVRIPDAAGEVKELEYLGGHSLHELLSIEQRATAGALAKRGRPNMTITFPRVDAHHVGELIMLFEIATIYAGALYDVNPLDQPGVELGKQFAYALLGRPGADAARKEWDELPRPNEKYRV